MILDQRVMIAAPTRDVWEFIIDVPRMSTCVPGLETVSEESPGTYTGVMSVTVGPISVRLEGRLKLIDKDASTWTTLLEVVATDRRIRSSLNANTTMRLFPNGANETELLVHTTATVQGKLGQLGQAVLRKKTDQVLAQFASNMAYALQQEAQPNRSGISADHTVPLRRPNRPRAV